MRPSYRRAIEWIFENDDLECLTNPDGVATVAMALVADLFGKTPSIVMRDVARRVSR